MTTKEPMPHLNVGVDEELFYRFKLKALDEGLTLRAATTRAIHVYLGLPLEPLATKPTRRARGRPPVVHLGDVGLPSAEPLPSVRERLEAAVPLEAVLDALGDVDADIIIACAAAGPVAHAPVTIEDDVNNVLREAGLGE